jgi:hypothetical protein
MMLSIMAVVAFMNIRKIVSRAEVRLIMHVLV